VSEAQVWRVGRSYGIHVYEVGATSPNGDRPVATFHNVRDAELAVAAVNAQADSDDEQPAPGA
jgi:hypothetical protein